MIRQPFPESFRGKIIDTQSITPNAQVNLTIKTPAGAVTLTRNDEVITFVARNLEPYRGYHIFMRALPEILRVVQMRKC